MTKLIEIFYYSFLGAALLLSVIGLWFTTILPITDPWSKRFFQCYFAAFMLCCLSSGLELIPLFLPISITAFYFILAVESIFLSVPLPMLTVYLLHYCGDNIRESRLFRAVTALWSAYIILVIAAPFFGGFVIITGGNTYHRGPLYPIGLLPIIAILLLNLAYTMRHRKQLSRKVYHGFLIAILPVTFALIVQLFADVYPLLDIGYALSALSMYGFVLADQIEQDRRHQMEIARQQQEIATERSSVMVLQMRPHFIYNTLMSIYSLCNIDPQKARQVTMDFTNYLRKNFNAVASDGTIPFSTELEHTRAYLAVEQVQHEDMLLVDYDTQFMNFRLPPLTLQPLVENSVKHGIDPYAEPLHVSVKTRNTDSGIEIIVEDNGPGFDPADESKPHTTLNNIKQRLEMMCNGSMSITPREGGGTVVKITIPVASE